MAHNAIDWLTRRWRYGALHDKPLAVIGRSAGRYTGGWSRQVEDTRGGLGTREARR
jgi:NAD(P)H-dependent FMN reductase